MPFALPSAFFLTALLYASVGFGGGSTYTALLAISGVSYVLIPIISLSCNMLVVSGNVWRYARQQLYGWRHIWPLLCLSVPAAWLGGRLEISETLFIGLLWMALLLAGLRLLMPGRCDRGAHKDKPPSIAMNALIGGAIGFLSGMVGIGGGIFLAPILHLMRWGSARQIAAMCSLFIFVNSLAGFGGQLAKLNGLDVVQQALAYWPLLPAVVIGGAIGNYLGLFKLSESLLQRLTGVLIVIVAIRLAFRWLALITG